MDAPERGADELLDEESLAMLAVLPEALRNLGDEAAALGGVGGAAA
jgi:hypothetical protein